MRTALLIRRRLLATTLLHYRIVNRQKKRSCWVHPINEKRKSLGQFHHLFDELKKDESRLVSYIRMNFASFEALVRAVEPHLLKCSIRPWISVEERLVVTVRYLATGASFRSLAFQFRMGKSTVAFMVKETCQAIWDSLASQVLRYITLTYIILQMKHLFYMIQLENSILRCPATESEWRQEAEAFFERWNFPNCVGAIDGKHITIKAPSNSGSLYFNYKSTFSTVLLAVVSADYRYESATFKSFLS
ncbi:MAG: transposase family protein [Gammaproteobacteria bacterium]|nr:transposase family protein [Gammaproteobacteria bacterium]